MNDTLQRVSFDGAILSTEEWLDSHLGTVAANAAEWGINMAVESPAKLIYQVRLAAALDKRGELVPLSQQRAAAKVIPPTMAVIYHGDEVVNSKEFERHNDALRWASLRIRDLPGGIAEVGGKVWTQQDADKFLARPGGGTVMSKPGSNPITQKAQQTRVTFSRG